MHDCLSASFAWQTVRCVRAVQMQSSASKLRLRMSNLALIRESMVPVLPRQMHGCCQCRTVSRVLIYIVARVLHSQASPHLSATYVGAALPRLTKG